MTRDIPFMTIADAVAMLEHEGVNPRFWLRDDDAVAVTPALDRLLRLTAKYAVPVALAIIPSRSSPELADYLDEWPLVTPVIHGWSHDNHAPPDRKKQELGLHRPIEAVRDDLKAARVPYSNYFRDELDDEISAVDASWQRLLDILRRVGSARFLLEEYSTAYEFVTNRSPLELTVEDSLGFLYRYSIIGFERAITGAGIIHQFKYQDEAVSFEADAASFLVHRALKETLGLTET